eukprot:gene4072-4454_t
MNQANQKAVIQEANMNLVGIRSIELDYFSTFYSNFGTQAALMIGFIVGSLSQVPGIDNPSGSPYIFIVLYWITSATTLASAIHSLVCSVFVQVFGQGLGLRGPLGSMIVAVEGMVIEQRQILWSFVITVLSFGLQCIGMYWIMMDQTNAIICTVITFIAMFYWYHYSLRLYNRFSWNSLKIDWKEEENPEEELEDLDPSVINALHREKGKSGESSPEKTKKKKKLKGDVSGGNDDKAPSNKSLRFDALERDQSGEIDLSTIIGDDEEGQQNDDSKSNGGDGSRKKALSVQFSPQEIEKNVTLGGYLTLKVSNVLFGDPWKRRYFVLRGTSIYYYKDKRSFQLEPNKPLNKRPIDMEGYSLLGDPSSPPYQLSLIPIDEEDIRKSWKFRTDTLAEYNQWVDLFGAALRQTDSGRKLGNQVVVQQSHVRVGGAEVDNEDL